MSVETTDATAPAPVRGGELAAGDSLGPYTIVGLIGAGGMGEVYRARDPRLARDVAIKVMRERRGDAATPLLAEAKAMARLAHPNVVTVHDVGTVAGRPYV